MNTLNKDLSLNEKIGYKELKFKEFWVNVVWHKDDKAGCIIAKTIIVRVKRYRRKIKKFIKMIPVKEDWIYIFAYEKKEAVRLSYIKKSERCPLTANTMFCKDYKRFSRINIPLDLDRIELSDLSFKRKLNYVIFIVFIHELFHAVSRIMDEEKIMDLTESFNERLPWVPSEFKSEIPEKK